MVDPANREEIKGQTRETAEEIKGEARETAEELKGEAREAAEELSEAARQRVNGLFSSQKNAVAEQGEKFSSVFQKMADEFDNQDQPYFSGYARNVASCADRFSQQLRKKDMQSLLHEAQQYSRREPALFIGGAIAAGFLVSRFLRSSSTRNTSANATQNDIQQY